MSRVQWMSHVGSPEYRGRRKALGGDKGATRVVIFSPCCRSHSSMRASACLWGTDRKIVGAPCADVTEGGEDTVVSSPRGDACKMYPRLLSRTAGTEHHTHHDELLNSQVSKTIPLSTSIDDDGAAACCRGGLVDDVRPGGGINYGGHRTSRRA